MTAPACRGQPRRSPELCGEHGWAELAGGVDASAGDGAEADDGAPMSLMAPDEAADAAPSVTAISDEGRQAKRV